MGWKKNKTKNKKKVSKLIKVPPVALELYVPPVAL